MEIRGGKDYNQENQTIWSGAEMWDSWAGKGKKNMKEKTEERLRKFPDSVKKVHC